MAAARCAINRRKRARAMQIAHTIVNRHALIQRRPACFARAATRRFGARLMRVDDRPTLAAPDDDPYLWLEEIEGERALPFVARQNTLTLEKFGGPGFARDRDTLAAIYDRPDNIPHVSRAGGVLYNLWKDAQNPRGLWRQTTLDEFRKEQPRWETLLDVARRQRRSDTARIRRGREGVRRGRLRAVRSQGRRAMARR
jgi:prolyl oligopeptidase